MTNAPYLRSGESPIGPAPEIHDSEASRRKISPDDLVALCRVFGITLAELAHGANPDDLQTLGI